MNRSSSERASSCHLVCNSRSFAIVMYLKLIFVVACKLYFLTLRLAILQIVHQGMSLYAQCDVVDLNLNISLGLRKLQSVYQGMSFFECCADVDVNFSFSLRLRIHGSVYHGSSSCAGCYVLERKLFFPLPCLAPLILHSFAFFLEGPLGAIRSILGRYDTCIRPLVRRERHCHRQTTRAYRLVVR